MQPKLLDPDQMNTDPKHGFACANHLHGRESSFEKILNDVFMMQTSSIIAVFLTRLT
jgi:hypothetical protein